MGLFFVLLPFYLMGNFHCVGMCGPLVMLLHNHPFRWYYFIGRTLSFTGVATLCAGLGQVLKLSWGISHVATSLCMLFGIALIFFGFTQLGGGHVPLPKSIVAVRQRVESRIAYLLLGKTRLAVFLFGLCTVWLPCGQTLVVFSACALSQDVLVGFGNGFAFALLTMPSLILALYAPGIFKKTPLRSQTVTGVLAVIVGALALLRGCADFGLIEHCILNASSSPDWHIVLY